MAAPASAEVQASGTAQSTAFMRALAAHDPREEIRGPDRLAEIFLEADQLKPIKDPAARAWVMQNKVAPGAYAFMTARTSFFDEEFKQALEADTPQVVLLGAGYDSRPYRFADLIRDTRIFELDTAPTQARKLECLHRAQVPIPAQVSFVPVNFETGALEDRLTQAGFNLAHRTFFLWEGVSYYLSAEAVDRMLAFVCADSPPGSSICFDYASLSPQALAEEGAKQLRQFVKSQYANEAAKFGIREGELHSFMAARGFGVSEHLTAADMDQKYLAAGLYPDLGRVPSLFCLVHAKVLRPRIG